MDIKSTSNSATKARRRYFGYLYRFFCRKPQFLSISRTLPPTYDEATTTTVGTASGVARKIRRVPKVDTNIVLLNLGTLCPENFEKLEINQLAVPPPSCSDCSAILSSTSTCFFCGTSNSHIPQEQLHVRRAAEEYTLVQGIQISSNNAANMMPLSYTVDKGLVVFCIDISGSSKSFERCIILSLFADDPYKWLSLTK